MPSEGSSRRPGKRDKGTKGERPGEAATPTARGRVDPMAGELFPPHLDQIEAVRSLSAEKLGQKDVYSSILESICGATDDSQPVEQYDGTLGVTVAFVNAHQSPVGQVQWNANLASIYTSPGNVSGVRWGTGTMISSDLFLTAGHLFDQTGGGWTRPLQNGTLNVIPVTEIATNMHVNFNFQVDPTGTLRPEQQFPILALLEYRLGGVDFAICRLGGNPGTTFGITQVSTTDSADGEEICIIGHPAGLPKRIEAGVVFHLHDSLIGYDDIDTLGGNSGSGVLRETDGRIVGVHTNGGCNAAGTGHNHGMRITAVTAQSPTLQGLLAPTLKVLDDTATFKFSDDPNTLKFSDDPTLKFSDDLTRKFADDPTMKFSDDLTRKFSDDLTIKFTDDGPTRKFTDDLQTLKFADDGVTIKAIDDGSGTLKAIDDVKLPGLDKQFGDIKIPGSDTFDPRIPQPGMPGMGGMQAAPFILATPHHSMAWARPAGGQAGEQQNLAFQYEQALGQLQELLQQGQQELAAIEQEYHRLLGEYQAISGQR